VSPSTHPTGERRRRGVQLVRAIGVRLPCKWGYSRQALSEIVTSDGTRTLASMEQPTRIDLLELDIDLRLTDLWREAADVTEWSIDVVAAFMRAAYGKGYCDAFTEESPGSLCHDHGYSIPVRDEPVRERDAA